VADSSHPRYQYACLPFRVEDGHPLVMMITSRETRRWILPKGQPETGRHPWEVAAQEAYEEAGLVGSVSTKAVAAYDSVKRMRSGEDLPCTVRVFLFAVEQELDDWPERAERERRWMSPGEAALAASEAPLAQLLLEFGALWP
jgi:8-oxo-dGTP pyrophosphatase MutT (NUDIX family)